MTSENNSPDTQKQQDHTETSETAEKKRISRLADEFAKRGKQRQARYDLGTTSLQSSDSGERFFTVHLTSVVIFREAEADHPPHVPTYNSSSQRGLAHDQQSTQTKDAMLQEVPRAEKRALACRVDVEMSTGSADLCQAR